MLAVGAEARLYFPWNPGPNGLGFATFDGQRVDVAQHIEGDGLAVGAEVDAHPGTFGGGETGGFPVPVAGGGGDVPLFLVLGEGQEG